MNRVGRRDFIETKNTTDIEEEIQLKLLQFVLIFRNGCPEPILLLDQLPQIIPLLAENSSASSNKSCPCLPCNPKWA